MAHRRHLKKAQADWHRADIVAALWKKGTTVRRLSVQHGYASGSLRHALAGISPRAERIIADAIGVPPQQIWPSRYDEQGHTLARPMGRPPKNQSSAARRLRNLQAGAGR